MKNFFQLNNWQIEIVDEHILLIKQFRDLFDLEFNKGYKDDVDGSNRIKAFELLCYIYLVYDWRTPFTEFSDKEKHEAAIESSGLLDEEILKQPVVMEAIRMYQEIQDTRLVKLLRSANRAIDELRLYFDTLDLQERDDVTGKPIFSAKDAIANISSLGKSVASLKELELIVKKDQEVSKGVKGDNELGAFDDDIF